MEVWPKLSITVCALIENTLEPGMADTFCMCESSWNALLEYTWNINVHVASNKGQIAINVQ